MKLQFDSNQQYQIDAINSAVDLFNGQPLDKGDFELEMECQNGQMLLGGELVIGNQLLLDNESIFKNLYEIIERNGLNMKWGKSKLGRGRME